MPRPPAKCGTDSGYTKHLRNKQEPCAECREAHAEENRRREGHKKRRPALCGTDSGYYRHRRRSEDACTDCKAAHAAAVPPAPHPNAKVCACGHAIRTVHDRCSRCRRSDNRELPPERYQSREPVAWKQRKGILIPVYEESEVA